MSTSAQRPFLLFKCRGRRPDPVRNTETVLALLLSPLSPLPAPNAAGVVLPSSFSMSEPKTVSGPEHGNGPCILLSPLPSPRPICTHTRGLVQCYRCYCTMSATDHSSGSSRAVQLVQRPVPHIMSGATTYIYFPASRFLSFLYTIQVRLG